MSSENLIIFTGYRRQTKQQKLLVSLSSSSSSNDAYPIKKKKISRIK